MTQPTTTDAPSEPSEAPKTKAPNADSGRLAAEQATEYDSGTNPFAFAELKLDDGTTIKVPPDPRIKLLDDDALVALNKLDFELESYDRHPDVFIPEQTIKDSAGNELKLASETRTGNLKTPERKTDPETKVTTLLEPPYQVQVAQIALGDDYARLRAGTIDGRRGSCADVWRIWNERGREIVERQRADSFRDGSSGVLEAVPETDSE